MKALVHLSNFEKGSEIRRGLHVFILAVACSKNPLIFGFFLRKNRVANDSENAGCRSQMFNNGGLRVSLPAQASIIEGNRAGMKGLGIIIIRHVCSSTSSVSTVLFYLIQFKGGFYSCGQYT